MNKPCKIIIHHSLTKDGKVVDFNAIKRYHIETNGWRDIGYHYVIENVNDQYKILKGRDEKAIGAHTKGENANSIGICLVGNFDVQLVPSNQLEKLVELIKDIRNRYGNIPVHGHCDFPNPDTGYRKSCPGKKFPWKDLEEKLVEYQNSDTLSQWAEDGYNFVKENNISDGTRPKDIMTREEMWTMLHRYHQRYGK
ncbi:MAG: peptidoglycan recognition protein family protein [Maledivibacter sp.]|nr:peptidoglycan recognition protein family protein [Maledivibacter sp.]